MDLTAVQKLLDSFYDVTGIPSAILDIDGNILTRTGWQEICTRFHRACSSTVQRCSQSENYINKHLLAKPYTSHKCLNGLIDYAAPIIIDNQHLGSIFTGQLLHEQPDEHFFYLQAQEYGFDETAYFDALRKVPIVPIEKMNSIISYFLNVSEILASMGLTHLQQIEAMNADIHNQKKAQEEILEQREWLRVTLASIGDAVIATNNEGKIQFINQVAESLTGYYGEEALGRNIETVFNIISEETGLPADIQIEKVLSDGVIVGLANHTALISKEGTIYSIADSAAPIKNLTGEIIGVVLVFRDVSKNKLAEEQLRNSEARFRELFNHMSSGVAVYEAKHGLEETHFIIKDFNRAAQRIERVNKDDIINRNITDVFPGVIDFGIVDVLERVSRTGKPEYYPIALYEDNRIAGWRENYVYKLPSNEIVTVYDDVTEKKQAEEMLINYHFIFESARDILTIMRFDGQIIDVNIAATSAYGYSRDELLKMNILDLRDPETVNLISNQIQEADTNGIQFETIHYRKDGRRPFPVEVSSKGMIINNERVVLSIIRDISERKQAEEAIKRQMESQDMLLKISRQLTGIMSDDIDDIISAALQELGKFNDADRCYVVLFSNDGSKVNGTYEWCAEGIQTLINVLQHPVDFFPWNLEKLRRFENVYISSVNDLPLEAQVEKKILHLKGTQSLVLVPIICENNLIGFLGFDSTTKQIVWSKDNITVLDLVAQIFANALQRKQFMQALKQSENYYRTIFENTGAATAILEEDLTISINNKKFEKLSGYSKKELENKKTWFDFVADEDQKMVHDYYHQRNTQPELVQREYEINFINRFRNVRNILISVDMIPGTLKRAISIVDITRQKQTQKKLEDNYSKMHRIMDQTVSSLATAVEIRDPYTAGHQRKLGCLAVAIAREMGLPKDEIHGISVAGTLHDIGKINVPNEILSKPGKLSEIEHMIIQTHCKAGYEIIKGIEFPWPVADIVLQHHERMNGSGYPMGLTGEEILPEASILAVADVIDAMASHRPYRASLGVEAALEEITRNKGILYEPEVVNACLKLFREKGYKLD